MKLPVIYRENFKGMERNHIVKLLAQNMFENILTKKTLKSVKYIPEKENILHINTKYC